MSASTHALGWCDLAFFCILKKRHISADQVYKSMNSFVARIDRISMGFVPFLKKHKTIFAFTVSISTSTLYSIQLHLSSPHPQTSFITATVSYSFRLKCLCWLSTNRRLKAEVSKPCAQFSRGFVFVNVCRVYRGRFLWSYTQNYGQCGDSITVRKVLADFAVFDWWR